MISGIFSAKLVLVAILITGVIGFPVGVPNPVVNKNLNIKTARLYSMEERGVFITKM